MSGKWTWARRKALLAGQPLYLRVKFNAADKSPSGTFEGRWQVGVPRKTPLWHSEAMSLAPDTFHEFEVPAYYDEKGVLTVAFANVNNTALLFPLEDGLEVLYRQGGFGLNFVRGLGIIFCWMALLAALGLAAASFLSFPVAAFLSLGVLTLALSSGTISNAVSEGTLMGFNSETGRPGHSAVDVVAIPVFRAVLGLINLAKNFSPIDSLSTGRSVSWEELAQAFGQIVLLLGGCLGLLGIIVFSRRELATAQNPMSGKLRSTLLLSLVGVLLVGAGWVQQSLNRDRDRLGLTRVQPLENAPPVLAFTTVALGGFRGPDLQRLVDARHRPAGRGQVL